MRGHMQTHKQWLNLAPSRTRVPALLAWLSLNYTGYHRKPCGYKLVYTWLSEKARTFINAMAYHCDHAKPYILDPPDASLLYGTLLTDLARV